MVKVYILDGGTFTQDQSIVTFAIGAGQKITSQVSSVYVDHPEAKIIIETGMDPEIWPTLVKQILAPSQKPEQRLDNALKMIGVKPEEIDIVINTHLHADHCSFNRLFKNASWLIQREELKQAYVPEIHEITYVRNCFDVGLETQLLDGDYEVVKGVRILDTRGHTAGHQSVAIETERSGVILVAGDAAMSRENLFGSERTTPYGWPCGPIIDARQYMRSHERLRRFVKETEARTLHTCTIMYGHDHAEFLKLKRAPHYYD
ncbi:MAG: N-acyl homoserine lactonase family protein [Candidatus Caldarchaeum sp.]|nr:N-acyl homoserine lactonase family protein [Candidatus Caldarchaeum sp.]